MTVSIFSAVYNRPEPIKYSVLSWLYRDVAEEIVLLDWNSDTPVYEIVRAAIKENCTRPKSELQDWKERLRIYRVDTEMPFRIGYGSNLAASLCGGDTLFKIDIDCCLVSEVIPTIPSERGNFFYNGNMNCQHENDRGAFGSFLMRAEDYWSVGGIDERYNSYGHEDLDLFQRLQRKGLQRWDLPKGLLYHLPHGNEKRMAYCADAGTIWESTKSNREKAEHMVPWDEKCVNIKYKITHQSDNYYKLRISS